MPQAAIECELSEVDGLCNPLFGELPRGNQDANSDGQIVSGTLFAKIGGRHVDGDALLRELRPGVPNRGAYALLRFRDSGIGEANDMEGGQARGDVDLDADSFPRESDNSTARDFGKHGGMLAIGISCAIILLVSCEEISLCRNVPTSPGPRRGRRAARRPCA